MRFIDTVDAGACLDMAVCPVERGDERTELLAVLVSTAAHPAELDAVIARRERVAGVVHGTWETRTRD